MRPRKQRLRNKSQLKLFQAEPFLAPFLYGSPCLEWFVNKGLSVASNSALLPKGGGVLGCFLDVDD